MPRAVLALALQIGGSFEPATSLPAPGFADLSVEEGPATRLEVSGARLERVRGEARAAIGCTDPAGTGAILDLARDPAGNTFVAAERGLFVLGPDVDSLDPVTLGEGAPPGRPTSVHVDARRRVWIGTDEAFGVVEPSFFWGRTIGTEGGLDRAGPYRVAAGEEGAIRVETPSGTVRYKPDLGPPPAVAAVALDGTRCEPGAVRHIAYGQAPRLSAEGFAAGGASFRWRIDRHHVWRSLELESPDPRLAPGAHVLEVVAIDRDLNRSEPFRVALAVDPPAHYEPRTLALGAALLALLFVGFGALRAVRRGGVRAWVRGAVGGAVAVVLLGQVVAGLVPHAKAWPFVGFSMYTETIGEGGITYDEGIVGLDAGGRRRWIEGISLGHDTDSRWQVLGSILEGGELVARGWLDRYNALHPGAPLVGLQVVSHRTRLTRDGPVPIAPLVFLIHPAEGTLGGR